MKKNKVLYYIVIVLLILFVLNRSVIVYASAWELTDEEAEAQANKMLKEQEKEIQESIGKSSNNYLSELSIDGLTLIPAFDKQTVEYKTNKDITDKTVKITAKAEDNKAKISGDGVVNLQTGNNELLVEVTAENGSVRTYHIKVSKKVSSNELKLKKLELYANDKLKTLLELSPEFDSDVFEYSCETYDETIKVEAQSESDSAEIKIEGDGKLKSGKNEIRIHVKEKDGSEENIYKINVFKREANTISLDENNKKNIIYACVAFVILVIICLIFKRKKHKKGSSRH